MSSTRSKVFLGLGLYFALVVAFVLIFGSSGENEAFQPQNEFKLDDWIDLGIFSINKAVLYIVAAGVLTVATMLYVANRMQARPNRVQTVVEMLYGLMRENITNGNLEDPKMARKWFPFIATIFLFIWFSNLIGYLPLPTNTEHKVDIFGLDVPAFALYAATANLSVPLVLALVVWVAYNVEGIRAKGFIGYMKSLIPAGVPGPLKGPLFFLELFSNIMRLMSLSVRLFANILAGHLIILFMGGALAVLLGSAAIGILTFPMGVVLFLFEVGLVATLQAFIFATLTAIYLGGAVAESH
ncbi:F0F1 ATP synthase subunit A [Conexibacter sp. SYSU D00693]|uniref:F0F1 ATP synthase subunit A n=1 Tax=Conexibacter sp. SYSU D00693 TaxID=2812560 RepID=UPI00196B4C2A|nr:F0F1 ATP synthase subunit A [Conexibacter sp. SYSU D00693]